jgi:hypothetical protein
MKKEEPEEDHPMDGKPSSNKRVKVDHEEQVS